MIKTYYHATDFKHADSILENGLIPGCDGYIYLCETSEDAQKFPYILQGVRDIVVVEVAIEEDMVEESFDHNVLFFKCDAFMHHPDGGRIEPYDIVDMQRYQY